MKSVRERLIKEISAETGVDNRVVGLVSNFEFKFAKQRIADDTDIRPVRLRYFAAFVPKSTYIKDLEESAKGEES